MIQPKYMTIPACLLPSGLALAASAEPVTAGEWETTSIITTRQGEHRMQTKTCSSGKGVSDIMPRQKDAHCGPWQETSSDGGREIVLHSV